MKLTDDHIAEIIADCDETEAEELTALCKSFYLTEEQHYEICVDIDDKHREIALDEMDENGSGNNYTGEAYDLARGRAEAALKAERKKNRAEAFFLEGDAWDALFDEYWRANKFDFLEEVYIEQDGVDSHWDDGCRRDAIANIAEEYSLPLKIVEYIYLHRAAF